MYVILKDKDKGNIGRRTGSMDIEFGLVGEFLLELKKEFGDRDEESVKVVELKRMEQEGKTIEEFVQKFKRVVRNSGYEGRALVEEFKRGTNRMIRRKLIETERSSTSIKQWYEHVTNLDRYQRESKREEKRLRERKNSGNQGQRQTGMGNNQRGF